MKHTYKNPWHRVNNVPKPVDYHTEGPIVQTHRRVQIINIGRWYDYVFEGMCITQRVGRSTKAIDDLLDGEACSDTVVAEHLRSHGHKPMSYDEYHKLWIEGKVA